MQDNRIISGGRERWKQTDDYRRKVAEIREEVIGQYALLLLSERNWLKRLILKGKRSIEIRKRITKLDSGKNLHLTHDPIGANFKSNLL
ncbi:MAG: hypothetical protein AAF944_26235 [Bacteroidota bacterium]